MGFRISILFSLFLQVIVMANFISHQPLTYQSSQGQYVYPEWANMAGWCISGSSMLLIPLVAIYQIIKAPGSLRQVQKSSQVLSLPHLGSVILSAFKSEIQRSGFFSKPLTISCFLRIYLFKNVFPWKNNFQLKNKHRNCKIIWILCFLSENCFKHITKMGTQRNHAGKRCEKVSCKLFIL